MAMKSKITDAAFKALAAHYQSEYKLQEDGSYLLDVEGVDGLVLENVQGLKRTLDDKKADLEKLKKEVDRFKDIDPERAREALAKINDIGTLSKDERVKQLVEDTKRDLATKHGAELEKLNSRVTTLTEKLTRAMTDGQIAAALAKHGGNLKLLKQAFGEHIKVVENDKGEFSVQVVNENGSPRTTLRTGSTEPMSIDELVETFKKDPDYQGAFKGSGSSGSGSSGGSGSGSGSNGTTIDPKLPADVRLAELRKGGHVATTKTSPDTKFGSGRKD